MKFKYQEKEKENIIKYEKIDFLNEYGYEISSVLLDNSKRKEEFISKILEWSEHKK